MTRTVVHNDTRPRWLVGAAYGGVADQTAAFIADGIWKNGYKDRYIEPVRSMRAGERIAIKSSYTRKHNLPFDNGGEFVSVLGIKAVGTIVENLEDGRVVRVEWAPPRPLREWYFYTERSTVWRVVPGTWKSDGLISFVFEDKAQDINRFLSAT